MKKFLEEVRLSLLADDMIPYIEYHKNSNKKLLELINEFSKVAGYKINIQKSFAFLYTNNELSERDTKKTIPFKIASIIPRSNLNNDKKDLYLESYKTLRKKIEEDTKKWKLIPCSWIGRINIIKMSNIPKVLYRFGTIPIKIPRVYFRPRTNISKIYMEPQKTPHSHTNLEKEEQSWRNHST